MKIPKSLVSIQKQANDQVSWHNIEKNIYDETVLITYIFRLFGLPLFIWDKEIITRHSFEQEKTMNKVTGFKPHVTK